MESRVDGTTLHHVEHGRGIPVVALHGAGVDHQEIESAIEAVVPEAGYRRIYPDLPRMGRSAAEGLHCNDDVVACSTDFIDRCVGGPALVVGHSYGAYLARGIAARRPDMVLGLALCCPVGERSSRVPEHVVVREDGDAYDELEAAQRAGFDEYFVVRTRTTARRYRERVLPGTALVDGAALDRIFAGWTVDLGSRTFGQPTLIVAGRRDSVAGCTDAIGTLAW